MKISNNLQITKTGQNNLAGKNKTLEFTEPVDTFTFSGNFAGAPDKSAGGWILNRKFVGAPDKSAGGWVTDDKPSNYPGDAIGLGSGSSSGSSLKFVGAPDRSAGGRVTEDKSSNYPGDAIGFGSGR